MSEQIKTSCARCVFALRDDDGSQYGCQLGRLSEFITRGQADLDNDAENYSYIIDRICNTCRNGDWAKKNTGKDPSHLWLDFCPSRLCSMMHSE